MMRVTSATMPGRSVPTVLITRCFLLQGEENGRVVEVFVAFVVEGDSCVVVNYLSRRN